MAEKTKFKHKFWREMSKYLKPYKKNLAIALFFTLFSGGGVALQPLIIKFLMDSGINSEPLFGVVYDTLPDSIKIVIFCSLAYLGVSVIRVYMWRIGQKQELIAIEGACLELRSDLFNHMQSLCMRFYDSNPSGKIFNYIMGSPMGTVKNHVFQAVMNIPNQVVQIIILFCTLFSYNWILCLLVFVTAFIMWGLNRLSRKRIIKISKDYIETETETSTYINDMLHGMDSVKIYSIEGKTISKFEQYLSILKNKGINLSMKTLTEGQRLEMAQNIAVAVVYVVGGLFCLYDKLSIGEYTAFIASMGSILGIISSWLNMALDRSNASVALDKVFSIMDETSTTPEIENGKEYKINEEKVKAQQAGLPVIECEHVAFAYDRKPIFTDFSCKINYNESIALVGASGSGKSTLTKLLLRLYEIDKGSIKLHGVDIKNYKGHDLRDSFGVVPQAPYIFHDTIWNNIAISNPDATDVEVRRAMHISRVDEFVYELPQGAQTIIGDGAVSLSGGQKQRVAIARAILKKTDFLIFDEATSALDNISEKYIQAAMEDLMKTHTVIIVAHRLSTIRNADRILVFDNGQIVQEGKYDYLANTPGMFADMLDVASKKTVDMIDEVVN